MPSLKDSKDAEEYATRGPFVSIFGGPVTRWLVPKFRHGFKTYGCTCSNHNKRLVSGSDML